MQRMVAWVLMSAAAVRCDGQQFFPLNDPTDPETITYALCVSADGKMIGGSVGTIGTGRAAFWDCSSGDPVPVLLPAAYQATYVSADGRSFLGKAAWYNAFGSGSLWRCDVEGACENLWPILSSPPTVESISIVYATSGDGTALGGPVSAPDLVGTPVLGWYRLGSSIIRSEVRPLARGGAMSDSGGVFYAAGLIAGEPYFFRWEPESGGAPEPMTRIVEGDDRVLGCSHDGAEVYLWTGSRLQRWNAQGFVDEAEGCCPGVPLSIGVDAMRVVGLRAGQDGQGDLIWVWDPLPGVRLLQDLVPGIQIEAARAWSPRISANGRVVIGQFRDAQLDQRGFAAVVPDEPCSADYTFDGNADQDDLAVFVGLLAGGDNPRWLPSDFNRDGNADQSDVTALIDVIAGGACP